VITFTTSDGVRCEGEFAAAEGDGTARAACVLCHPHPQHGGNMRSIVIGALFAGLPPVGVACLRFNYRGVEGSEGSYGGGVGELLDVIGAIDAMEQHITGVPLLLAGWSFGGDMALATNDERVAGWFAVAPPLRMADRAALDAVGGDPRPKHIALAQHDQFRAPEAVQADMATWKNTEVEVIGGADHFFVGRTARVVELAVEAVNDIVAQP
jgi:alpha/beta superfamily hydrolase